jgi:hypothetical protein
MKNIYVIIIVIIFLFKPNQFYSQNGGDIAVAGEKTTLVNQLLYPNKEQFERRATEWVLSNMDMKKFNVEILSYTLLSTGDTKQSDESSTRVVPFKLYEFELKDLPGGEYQFTIVNRYILIMYSFPGFISANGIDYTDVVYELVDKELWFKRMSEYVTSASNTEFDVISTLEEGIILNKGITNGAKKTRSGSGFGNNYDGKELKIRFYKLDGDSYIVSDYEDEFKYLYNEKSLGMFHKPTKRLFQLRAKSIREIHEFLLRETPLTL